MAKSQATIEKDGKIFKFKMDWNKKALVLTRVIWLTKGVK